MPDACAGSASATGALWVPSRRKQTGAQLFMQQVTCAHSDLQFLLPVALHKCLETCPFRFCLFMLFLAIMQSTLWLGSELC